METIESDELSLSALGSTTLLAKVRTTGGEVTFFCPLPKVPANFGFAHMGKNGQKWAKMGKMKILVLYVVISTL